MCNGAKSSFQGNKLINKLNKKSDNFRQDPTQLNFQYVKRN